VNRLLFGPAPGLPALFGDVGRIVAAHNFNEVFAAFGYANIAGTRQLLAAIGDLSLSIVLGAGPFQTSLQVANLLVQRPRTRVYLFNDTRGGLFHPKLVSLWRRGEAQFIYIGSSNLTGGGLGPNLELNCKLDVSTEEWAPARADFLRLRRVIVEPPASIRLTTARVPEMVQRGHLYDETINPHGGRVVPQTYKVSTRFGPIATVPPVEFVMTLAPNDISGKHLDKYFLVPKRDRDLNPDFWGWPAAYTGAPHLRRLINMVVRLPGGGPISIPGRIYFVAGKTEFRVSCPPIHDLGMAAADWLLVLKWTTDSTLHIRGIQPTTPAFDAYLERCTVTASIQKRFGYI